MALGAGTGLERRPCQPGLFPSSKKVTTLFFSSLKYVPLLHRLICRFVATQIMLGEANKSDGIAPVL